jgi:hypothetical protein
VIVGDAGGGIRPGATVAAAAKRLKLTLPFHIGLNYWYLTPNGTSTGVLKARQHTVEEIGIADKQLTQGRKQQRAFLTSFAGSVVRDQATSKRSRFITLTHAATKSDTNFSRASSLA